MNKRTKKGAEPRFVRLRRENPELADAIEHQLLDELQKAECELSAAAARYDSARAVYDRQQCIHEAWAELLAKLVEIDGLGPSEVTP